MSDIKNFLAGKDWIITITIPNRLLSKYPREVQLLQFSIRMELERFNTQVKKIEKNFQQAIIETPETLDKNIPEAEKQAIVAKMEDDRKREAGEK